MSRITLVALFAIAACTVGPSTPMTTSTSTGEITYLDSNHDGHIDSIDVDQDDVADYFFDLSTCTGCADLHPVAFCANPLVDENGDGQADGLDWDCDGVIDVRFGGGGGGGSTSSSTCDTSSSINGESHEVKCTTDASGVHNCDCLVNGTVTSTCSTSSNDACSLPVGTCCTF